MKDDQREEFNFVLNSLINFEPVKRFKNRRNVMKLARAAAFRTSCRRLVRVEGRFNRRELQ